MTVDPVTRFGPLVAPATVQVTLGEIPPSR
jgi:hypothetical protein